jgi:hypothetical protein
LINKLPKILAASIRNYTTSTIYCFYALERNFYSCFPTKHTLCQRKFDYLQLILNIESSIWADVLLQICFTFFGIKFGQLATKILFILRVFSLLEHVRNDRLHLPKLLQCKEKLTGANYSEINIVIWHRQSIINTLMKRAS